MMDYYEEVLLLRKKVEKYETILKHAMSEKSGAFFICGEAGEKDSMDLHRIRSIETMTHPDGEKK